MRPLNKYLNNSLIFRNYLFSSPVGLSVCSVVFTVSTTKGIIKMNSITIAFFGNIFPTRSLEDTLCNLDEGNLRAKVTIYEPEIINKLRQVSKAFLTEILPALSWTSVTLRFSQKTWCELELAITESDKLLHDVGTSVNQLRALMLSLLS